MKIEYFTSMDKKYYDHCGKTMLESFVTKFKKRKKINLYNEDDFDAEIKNINYMGWDLGTEYEQFISRWQHNKKITTFAKKGFSIIHAMNNIDCDRLIWLDADSVVKMPLHGQLVNFMCPDDVLSSHFKVAHVEKGVRYESCETGFFILNKNHPNFNEFKNTYTEIYHKDQNKNIRRFYDGEVYGETVRRLEENGVKMVNLNPGPHKTPIPRSLLGPYFQHFKAGLKDNISNDILEERYLNDQDEV